MKTSVAVVGSRIVFDHDKNTIQVVEVNKAVYGQLYTELKRIMATTEFSEFNEQEKTLMGGGYRVEAMQSFRDRTGLGYHASLVAVKLYQSSCESD